MQSGDLSGMLVIRKEPGYTSNDVVAKLRGILHMKKIGHTGTLDPDAEGVLPVCLGSATKLVDLIADRDKEYIAVLRLGVKTDTQDLSETASILHSIPDEEVCEKVNEIMIREAAASFTGKILQTPPMYSARKVNGHKLYEYARRGVTIEREARPVTIYELEVLSIRLPEATLRVRCSKGTYIRTLCEDLGDKLGVYGAMKHLTRTRVGIFGLDKAVTLGEIEERMHRETGDDIYRSVRPIVAPIDSFFEDCTACTMQESDDYRLRNGNALTAEQLGVKNGARRIRVYDSKGRFTAVYRFDDIKNIYSAEKMFL